MTIKDIHKLVESELEILEKDIANISYSVNSFIPKVGEYSLETGKRIRPIITFLTSKMLDNNSEYSRHIGLAAELLHNATLLHDDIVDDAVIRRGRKTAYKKYGSDVIVLCGDFFYTKAFSTLVKNTTLEIVDIFTDAASDLCEGELDQLETSLIALVTYDDYLEIICKKTGVLFEACTKSSAVCSTQDSDKIRQLADFGLYIGILFQLTDDILDYTGDTKHVGKAVGRDLFEGKKTLPLILLMKNVDKPTNKKIQNILKDKNCSEEQFQYILELIKAHSLEDSKRYLKEINQKAKDCLKDFDNNIYKEALISVVDYITLREK